LTPVENESIIKVYPTGKRTKVLRKRRRIVYVLVNEEPDYMDDPFSTVSVRITDVYDAKAKAEAALDAQLYPENYYIVPRILR